MFVAALEYAVMDVYDEKAVACAAAVARHPRVRARGASRATMYPRFSTGGRLGEIVAICSVAAVLAGTAAKGGPQVVVASTPTTLAAATDTATPAGAIATPAVANRP